MAASLRGDGIERAAIAVDDHHFHVLARFVDHVPRRWIGLAKRRSALTLVKAGLAERGGVWAVRCRCLPVRDRRHQVNVARYIAAHERRGAAVWVVWREGQVDREIGDDWTCVDVKSPGKASLGFFFCSTSS